MSVEIQDASGWYPLRARRVTQVVRRASSPQIVVETQAGRFFTKLRGSAQGPSVLVAEVIVAEIAEALGLRVPARALVTLDSALLCDDRDTELWELLSASHGLNLGFQFLIDAKDLRPEQIPHFDEYEASKIVWLDWLVMNPDRTPSNMNIMLEREVPWLIDHGAALGFHHNWFSVTEDTPREEWWSQERHLLWNRATQLGTLDAELTRLLTKPHIQAAVARVPEDFMASLLARGAPFPDTLRLRAAYAAFLWKRLKGPRPFA